MKLIIMTQTYENYAFDKDGNLATGDNKYWKAKGGNDYVVTNFKHPEKATETVMALREKIETSNDYFFEMILGWDVVSDDYVTKMVHPVIELTLE